MRILKKAKRHALLAALALMFTGTSAAQEAAAPTPDTQASQQFPTKPVRIIAWAGPGSAFDTLARMLSDELAKRWKVTVTVENKVGAGGIVGTQYAARAPADGSTILISTNSAQILNFLLKPNLSFDPKRDFIPVSKLADGQTTLVVAKNSPHQTLAEFLEAAKTGQGLTYSSFAIGSASHLMGEQLQRVSGAQLVHVPYAGGEMAALTDLVGGRLDSAFMSESTALVQSEADTIRILAITGNERTKQLPNVATFAEQGYGGLDLSGWIGMFLPAGTPQHAVDAWSTTLQEIVASPAMNERMATLGFQPVGSSAEEFQKAFTHDFKRWEELVKVTEFKPQ